MNLKTSLKTILILCLLLPFVPRTGAAAASDLLKQNDFYLNREAAISGYTFRNFEDNFVVGITPYVLSGGGDVVFKMLNWEYFPVADNMRFVSPVYEFDIMNKDAYDIKRPIWLKLKYMSDLGNSKSIYYYNKAELCWVRLPSTTDNDEGVVKAAIHLPYARVTVLEDDIMSVGVASWYEYKNCNCAASPDYPKGTLLKVTNLENSESVIVKVNDWGPERDIFPDRVIDLDLVAFEQIGNPRMGLINVKVEPL